MNDNIDPHIIVVVANWVEFYWLSLANITAGSFLLGQPHVPPLLCFFVGGAVWVFYCAVKYGYGVG